MGAPVTPLLTLAAAALSAAPTVASYTIRAELDPPERSLRGSERIVWINTAPAPARTLQFHLYLNAFRDRRSTFLRDEEWPPERWEGVADPWGWIEVEEARLPGGEDLLPGARSVAPDDGNPHDRTVLEVPLPRPVPPGGRLEIDVRFRARVPRLYTRTGQRGDFYFMAQWYPKLGVYEAVPGESGRARWNCHQFHPASEFFADFGVYDVEISVPAGTVVAAAGERVERRAEGGRSIERFRLEPAHDFAWAAWPGFALTEREFVRSDGRPLRLRLFHPPDRGALAERHAAVLERGVRTLEEWIGPYPYRWLTVVEAPPEAAGEVEWMEYPGLITLHSPRLLSVWPFTGVRVLDFEPFDTDWNLEEVDLHELGHQWWYGSVATNEFEDPWMDEGINTYVTGKLLDHLYGPRQSAFEILGMRAGIVEHDRVGYTLRADVGPPTAPSWGFVDTDAYSLMVYTRTALVLRTLEGVVGENAIRRALRHHFEAGLFRHPRPADFLRILEGEAGRPLAPLWRPLMEGTAGVDFRVEWVRELDDPEDPRWLVTLRRRGDVSIPVWVEFRYADGARERSRWENERRWIRYTLRSASPLVRVEIDPDREVPLDTNRLDNAWAAASGPAPRRWAWVAAGLASLWIDLWAALL